ncbi:Capreomycidine synthase [Tolypocladium ophioglossoides CBS 100239]|uniref:Capreomycidine synthase n=1 Tax=Tolypocladium ophioglossoides (strain CBS 100239) TaxID=1163406 RepID=A0A0L0NB34_TOLOC|nr:Capreomycidine synthase [Tolypocladium ophioglossoides CBS 100239]
MVRVRPFEVERWMDKYENTPGILNVAETCCSSVSVDDLYELSQHGQGPRPLQTAAKLTYGSIRGSSALRERVASLCNGQESEHTKLTAEEVIITQGAIAANFLVLYSLIGPGDHVVCVHPTYQQLYSVPESLGAEVSLWRLREDKGYLPDVGELDTLVRENTKSVLLDIAKFARKRGLILLSDEVYRPLFHNGFDNPDAPPSAASSGYEKTIVTGSMSKAFSLAGIRVGWVVSRDKDIVTALAAVRDYTTISVSQLDDQLASYALSPAVRGPLLDRNISLARRNNSMLDSFVKSHSSVCRWVQPAAGTTAFIQFLSGGMPVDDVAFCVDVLEKTKVFFCPGSRCFGEEQEFRGYVRVGYACETSVLSEALERLHAYVQKTLS